jgi:hypothetical protein
MKNENDKVQEVLKGLIVKKKSSNFSKKICFQQHTLLEAHER